MNPLRVIFLDIDGVLNSSKSNAKTGDSRILGTHHVGVLNYIVEKTGAVLVISSVHRKMKSIVGFQRYLDEQGVHADVLDLTPVIVHQTKKPDAPEREEGEWSFGDYDFKDAKRGEEIQKWLDDFRAVYPKRKVQFVILDDDRDMLHLMDHLVLTRDKEDNITGLLMKHVEPAVKLLKGITW